MQTVSVEKQNSRWIARCSYEDRAIPKAAGFRWDPAKKQWFTTDAAVAAKLSDPEGAAKLLAQHQEKEAAKAAAIDSSRAASADVDLPVPDGLAYLPYQRAGIASALTRQNVLLGDEMGLGKTIQAIGIVNADTTLRKIVIVCPASLKLNWKRELTKWLVRPAKILIAASKPSSESWDRIFSLLPGNQDIQILIINYDLLTKWAVLLHSMTFDLLCCDEAHYLKNPSAKRTQAIVGHEKKGELAIPPMSARRSIFLTGTPIPNRPVEGWALFHFLAPDEFRSFFGYTKRYCAAEQNGYGWDFSGSSNLPELQNKLRGSIMIRRLKADVLTELPAKRRAILEISGDGSMNAVSAEKEAWERKEEALLGLRAAAELAKASSNPNDYADAVARLQEGAQAAFTELARLRHATAVAKIPYVVEHLRDIIDSGTKCVCFAHHKDVITALEREFGAAAVSLYGETPMATRQANVDRFQSDPTCMLFVGGIQAAGVGITLTAASHVVFAELDWVPGNMTQAEDRCILEGQPILTESGWRPIESISVGDQVITRSGRLARVTDAWSRQAVQGRDTIIELEVSGWRSPLVTTGNHPYLLTSGEWKNAEDLRPGDRLSGVGKEDPSNITELLVPQGLRVPDSFEGAGGIQKNGRKLAMPESVQVDQESLFVFGYYLGDGFARIADQAGRFVCFSGNDGGKLKSLWRCEAWMRTHKVASTYTWTDGSHGVEMRSYSAEWARWFGQTFGRVCLKKHIPSELLGMGEQQSRWLLEGLLASDGYQRHRQAEYCTASELLAAHVAIIVARAGYFPRRTMNSTGQHIISWSLDPNPGPVVRSIKFRQTRKGSDGKRERVYDLTVEGGHAFVLGLVTVSNCHRIGQRDMVLVQHLVLEGSLDARMASILVEKQEVIAQALDTEVEQVATLPVKEKAATESTSRARVDREAPAMTPGKISAVHQALQILADRCNYAATLDGAGFSRIDTMIGHSLAECSALSARQAVLGAKLAQKYRRQLPDALLAEIGIGKK